MTDVLTPLIPLLGIALAGEMMLWSLFRRRIDGVVLPRRQDVSAMRFLTLRRLEVLAVVHTLCLFACLILAFVFLW